MKPSKRKEESVVLEEFNPTKIWQKYQNGINYINKINLINTTDKCHKFFEGDQWSGLEADGEELPLFNFIKGIVKYKVSTVAQNTMSAVYSPMEDKTPEYVTACNELNKFFSIMWERAKMDDKAWKIIKDACIQGDSYLYFGGSDVTEGQLINNVNILFSDEQNQNIQEQKYIIITERRFISDIKAIAKSNGVPEDMLDLIMKDNKTENEIGNKQEVDSTDIGDGKCLSLLYLYKDEEGIVHSCRCTENLIYEPDTKLVVNNPDGTEAYGLTYYPIVSYVWEDKKNSARGTGEVEHLIPNQLELNKTLARRAIAVKQFAYPKLAYNENAVTNPENLDVVGGKIGLKNGSSMNVQNLITYLNPASMSGDAQLLSNDLMTVSKDLSGAGDAAMGQIDPSRASGQAIIAVRDQAQLPLNEQVAKYKQFVEDLALVWYNIWLVWNANGITAETDEGEVINIPTEVMEGLKIQVRIDVSQNNPYSKYAQEQALENLFQNQHITFEEYVKALPADSVAPKATLEMIVANRPEMPMQQQNPMMGVDMNAMQGM